MRKKKKGKEVAESTLVHSQSRIERGKQSVKLREKKEGSVGEWGKKRDSGLTV